MFLRYCCYHIAIREFGVVFTWFSRGQCRIIVGEDNRRSKQSVWLRVQEFRRKHIKSQRAAHAMLGDDLKFAFASAGKFTAGDYVSSARIRGRMAVHCRAVFDRCDVLVTPTVPNSPPRLAHEGCVSHMAAVGQTMKYVQLGNLMGLPAVTVPCALDAEGLPVGCGSSAAPSCSLFGLDVSSLLQEPANCLSFWCAVNATCTKGEVPGASRLFVGVLQRFTWLNT